jgi:PKD repeat protein
MNRKIAAIFLIFYTIFMGAVTVQAVNWPLRISANGKYLEDQDGLPFLIVGEAAWSMAVQLTPSDVINYLDDRKAKGFTAILINGIEHRFSSKPPYNYANQHPFSNGSFDWSIRNENYWSHVDYILNEAKKRDILVFLFPAYLGISCGSEGWCSEMVAQTNAAMMNYGEWLGNRYGNQGNIVWVHGGDANASAYPGAYDRVAALASGIKSRDSYHLHTAGSSPESSALDDYAALIELNTTYSYSNPQEKIQNDYQRSGALPFTYMEGYYENEHSSTVRDLHRQALTAYLGGALLGHFFGNCPIWNFGGYPSWCGVSSWQEQLESAGSKSMANIGSLMKSREWWKLEPDYQNTVVTSGKGSGTSYKAAARASDGRTIMVWFPDASKATIDLSKISGQQAKAYWWNPNDNISTLIGTYAATGAKDFNPNNADMVLIIDVDSAGLCTPGQPSANFFGNPISGPSPLTVFFTDATSGNPTSWYWDFGDGQTTTEQNPIHIFNVEGTYTVSLKVLDNNDCLDTETKTKYITVTGQTIKKKIYAYSEINVIGTTLGDLSYTLSNDNIYESITEVLSSVQSKKATSYLEHKWLFKVPQNNSLMFFIKSNRLDNSDTDNFIFEYSTDNMNYINLITVMSPLAQIYSVILPPSISGTVYVRVKDTSRNLGKISLDTISIDEIYFEADITPVPPIANFYAYPTSGPLPLNVNFTDQSTGNPSSWYWDFGDGLTSTVQNPTHTYSTAGTYSVSMTAENEYGSNKKEKFNLISVTQSNDLTIHVSNTKVIKKIAGKNQIGQAFVTVVDGNGSPVQGAVVYGFFNYPNNTIKSGTTGANGIASISADRANSVNEYCYSVTDITLYGVKYNHADNSCAYACESGCVSH